MLRSLLLCVCHNVTVRPFVALVLLSGRCVVAVSVFAYFCQLVSKAVSDSLLACPCVVHTCLSFSVLRVQELGSRVCLAVCVSVYLCLFALCLLVVLLKSWVCDRVGIFFACLLLPLREAASRRRSAHGLRLSCHGS